MNYYGTTYPVEFTDTLGFYVITSFCGGVKFVGKIIISVWKT